PPDPRPDPTLTLACGLVALLTLVQFLALLRIHKVKEALLPGVPDPHSSFLGLSEKHHGNFQTNRPGFRIPRLLSQWPKSRTRMTSSGLRPRVWNLRRTMMSLPQGPHV
ncbi:cytokine receptor-like factor 2, partial [Rattus norvegicus]|uniref:cytokine receptor-like factor 2 n=1 Tax=Rattus norvegicus TaxID=10116 RepID=UPI002FD7B6F1